MLKIEIDKASLYTAPCRGSLSQFPPAVGLSYHCATKESRYRSYDTIILVVFASFAIERGVTALVERGC